MAYRIFTRTWWKRNSAWPNGKEPHPGKKRYIAEAETIEEARRICKEYNDTHSPGFLSRKAEFE